MLALLLAALSLPVAASVSAATCDKVFTGNATGARDVTASLSSWLRKYHTRNLCLKRDGVYRIDGTVKIANLNGLHLNGRNATLKAYGNRSASDERMQLRIDESQNINISHLKVRGTNPDYRRWNDSRQGEAGIGIFGGSVIRLTYVNVRNTYGDGIYIGYWSTPSTRVSLSHITVTRTGRSGVAVVGGNRIIVSRSRITDTGMHSVNLEPNTSDGNIHHVTVRYSYFARYGVSDVWNGYAFNAYSVAGGMRAISVYGNRAPTFHASVLSPGGGTYDGVIFKDNVSTNSGQAFFENVTGLTFTGNRRITAHRVN